MRCRSSTFVAGLILATLTACTPDEARVTVRFQWSVPPPTEPDRFRVEAEVRAPGGQRTPAAPFLYAPGARLEIGQVPVGSGLVVRVRFFDTFNENFVRYVGSSEPFEFRAGQDIEVPVEIGLTDAPELPADSSLAVRVVNARRGRVAVPQLELDVRGRGYGTIEVAQDLRFEQGRVAFASDAQRMPATLDDDGFVTHRLTYDLNQTLPQCRAEDGGDPRSCEGLRQVFVRGRRSDFLGAVQSATVTLDTRPPGVARASVEVQPSVGNPVRQAEGAAPGTRIVVSVLFDEAIDAVAGPGMVATNGIDTVAFEILSTNAAVTTSVDFAATVTDQSSGTYVPRLTLQDLAGNRTVDATFSSPAIVVDADVPTLVVEQDAVSYIRTPVGRATDERLDADGFVMPGGVYYGLGPADSLSPADHLPASVFRFADGSPPIGIQIWSDALGQELLRTVRPSDDGRWARLDLRLPNADAPRVYVTGFDEVGNSTDPVLIENAWFIATSADAPSGPTPHDVATAAGSARPRSSLKPIAQRNDLETPDGTTLLQASTSRWTERAQDEGPPSNASFEMVFDGSRGRLMHFGGIAAASPWEWDGSRWIRTTPVGEQPPPLRFYGMAYDAARGRILVFGGFGAGDQQSGDTWEWDGTQWTNVTPLVGNPPTRAGTRMVYDHHRGRVVMFGGRQSDADETILGDTWEWDGEAWQPIVPSGDGPESRLDHALAYDGGRRRVVLFGGRGPGSVEYDDTWEFDGVTWVRRSSASSPGARWRAGMAYDPERQRVVLFGGGGDNINQEGTWEWDGTDWTRITDTGPTPRNDLAMAYDPTAGGVVIYAGFTEDDLPRDLQVWDGQKWSVLHSSDAEQPSPRVGFDLVYDSVRREHVMFGGTGLQGSERVALGDMWRWSGSAWTEMTAPNMPRPRSNHAAAFDPNRGEMVIFGGSFGPGFFGEERSNETWVWDGTTWTQRFPEQHPPALLSATMIHDAARDRVVLFGGLVDGEVFLDAQRDTWEWDGASWTLTSTRGPDARGDHAMAYDPVTERVLVFGGTPLTFPISWFNDLWAWDGSTWVQLDGEALDDPDEDEPVPRPSPRSLARMTYDAGRQRMILFGGWGRGGMNFDAWEWDGASWTEVTPDQGSPPPRMGGGWAYDPARGTSVLFGGQAFGPVYGDTWELSPPGRPVVQFAPRLPDDIERRDLLDLRVRAHCGGSFATNDGPRHGAVLNGWRTTGAQLGWARLGQNQAAASSTPGGPALIDYEPMPDDSVAATQGLFLGRERRMYLKCQPLEASADGDIPATIAADYFEVRVKYATE